MGTPAITIFMALAAVNNKVKDKEFGEGFGGYDFPIVSFLFYFVVFLVVIGLLILVLRVLKRQSNIIRQGSHLHIMDSVMLSKETSIHLIEISGKIMVVGAGKEVSLLTVIDDPEIIKEIVRERAKKDNDSYYGKIWNNILEKIPVIKKIDFLREKGGREAENARNGALEEKENAEFEQELKEQLEKLKQLEKERGGEEDEK